MRRTHQAIFQVRGIGSWLRRIRVWEFSEKTTNGLIDVLWYLFLKDGFCFTEDECMLIGLPGTFSFNRIHFTSKKGYGISENSYIQKS
jgi:hypothetical protein